MTDFETVRVALGSRSYDIEVGSDSLKHLGDRLAPLLSRKRVFVLSDDTVFSLHGQSLKQCVKAAGLSLKIKCLPAGEATKSWQRLGETLDWLLQAQCGRDDVLIAFGGGVIGDLAGLAAALLKRGMKLVQIPTTLLAQVDSSVGGKTAINSEHGKNLIGAFYQPSLVLIDLDLLRTLPERQITAGYAEILKYGLIQDKDFLDWLSDHAEAVLALEPAALGRAVATSCRAKADIVALDEQEGGVRALLNLGHTFGHALEHLNGYGPQLLHGEAVGTGMALALLYSKRLGLINADQVSQGCALIRAGGLQADLSSLSGGPYEAAALTEAMRQDKKARGSHLPLILLKGLGEAFIYPQADLTDLEEFLRQELNQMEMETS